MITGAQIVAAARERIGDPFQHQGRTPGVALDCLGLIGVVAEAVHIPGWQQWHEREVFRAYGRSPRPDILIATCNELLDRVTSLQLGDILVMAFKVFPQHFAFVSRLNPTYIIHAYPLTSVERVVETGVNLAGAKVVRAYRFRGVA